MRQGVCGWALCMSVLTMCLVGCGPKVQINLGSEKSLPRHLALLPGDYSVDIPTERIDVVRGSLASELRNRNFIVADSKVVQGVCSTPACPERTKLTRDFLVDGFVTLSIDSFSKSNFLAGYYNQLSGQLTITDQGGKEVAIIQHTESERGGLLFNTGQILQGVISQVRNSGDAAYDELASQFAKRVVDQLPEPVAGASRGEREGAELTLKAVSAAWQTPSTYSVCARGTPHSLASILIGSQRTTMREVSPGNYCTAFSALVTPSASNTTAVELRTAYGNSVRQDVKLPAYAPCSLENRVQVSPTAIRIECAQVGSDTSRLQSGCSEQTTPCRADKVVLFRALSEAGPYEKVTEARSATTGIAVTAQPLALIAVGSGGVSSLPVTLHDRQGLNQ